jgi:hypothetical protein
MNARASVLLAMVQEDLLDFSGKAGIFSAMLARLPVFPSIIATFGDLQRGAEQRERVLLPLLGDERKF